MNVFFLEGRCFTLHHMRFAFGLAGDIMSPPSPPQEPKHPHPLSRADVNQTLELCPTRVYEAYPKCISKSGKD